VVNFSICADHAHDLLSEHVLPPLVEMLSSPNCAIQEQAAWALANLSSNPSNKMWIIEMGALEALRTLHKSDSVEVQAASGQVLDSLGEVLTPMSRRAISGERPQSIRKTALPKGSRLAGATTIARDAEAGSPQFTSRLNPPLHL